MSTTTRSRQFVDFLDRVHNDHKKHDARLEATKEQTISSNAESRTLQKKLHHMTKLTKVLAKSLGDKQTLMKQAHLADEETINVNWGESDDVSNELITSLAGFKRSVISDCSRDLASTANNYTQNERNLREELLQTGSECFKAVDVDDSARTAQRASCYHLIEARATVRHLEYKRLISAQQNLVFDGAHTISQDHQIDRNDIVELIDREDNEVEDLRLQLRGLISQAISEEKDIHEEELQRERIKKQQHAVKKQIAVADALIKQGDRLKTVLLIIEKDKKLLRDLEKRVTMIDHLMKNDKKSTEKVKEIMTFEARGSYRPSQLEGHDRIDKRDLLLCTVSDILIGKSGEDIVHASITSNCLSDTAAVCKQTCDERLDALSDVLLDLQKNVKRSEESFLSLQKECKHLDEMSSQIVVQEHLRLHNRHKSKVTALLADLKMKIETSNGDNGLDSQAKIKFAKAERDLIDMYLQL